MAAEDGRRRRAPAALASLLFVERERRRDRRGRLRFGEVWHPAPPSAASVRDGLAVLVAGDGIEPPTPGL